MLLLPPKYFLTPIVGRVTGAAAKLSTKAIDQGGVTDPLSGDELLGIVPYCGTLTRRVWRRGGLPLHLRRPLTSR